MIVDVDFDLARNERHGNATRRPNGGPFAEAQVPYAKIMGCAKDIGTMRAA